MQSEESNFSLLPLLEDQSQKKTISFPMEFQFLPVDLLSKEFTKLNNNHKHRIHYLGPRFHNTLMVHKKYAFTEKMVNQNNSLIVEQQVIEQYKVDTKRIVQSYFLQEKLKVSSFYKSTLFYRAFEGMNPTLDLTNQYVFNSFFESGNLDCVIKIQERQFDLFLRIDSNTRGHAQWFYFSIKNNLKKQKVKLNLCNLSKAKTLYEHGMQPYIFSKCKSAKKLQNDWQQGGVNISFQKQELRYEFLDDKINTSNLNCLTLEYQFEFEEDEVFLAYCIPYTYSKLLHSIRALDEKIVKTYSLGKTLSGVDIPLLQITNFEESRTTKKNILITGRIHPGEPNSSYMLQGFIQYMTSDAAEVVSLRNKVHLIIIPMVNPDGVIIGNTRTSAAGKDLNRQFINTNKDLFPEVHLVKEFARKLHQRYTIFMYMDFHGHSRKKNTFFYGPVYSIAQPNYYKCRIFPKLVEKFDSNFRFHSCSFNINEEKKQTARASMFQNLKIQFTYTVESSIGFYYDCEQMKTVSYTKQSWNRMGISICEGLTQFIFGFEEYENLIKIRRESRQRKFKPEKTQVFSQDRNSNEEEIETYRRMQPLKITYNDKSMFKELIEEIKKIAAKPQNFLKEPSDQDEESDDHDDEEDLEIKGMKELASLITETKNSINHPKKSLARDQFKEKEIKSQRWLKNCSNTETKSEDEEEKLLFQEIEEKKKFVKRQMPSTSSEQRKNNNFTRKSNRGSTNIKFSDINSTAFLIKNSEKTVNLNEKKEKIKRQRQKINLTINQIRNRKKISSESQIYHEKAGYYGQFQFIVDEQRKNTNPHLFTNLKASIFTRQKNISLLRKAQEDVVMPFSNKKCFQKSSQRLSIDSMNSNQQKNRNILQKPLKNTFQFKFDEIDAEINQKQYERQYLRVKIPKSHKPSGIGPASFYGIRLNINSKINQRKRFFEKNKKDAEQEKSKISVKMIKF